MKPDRSQYQVLGMGAQGKDLVMHYLRYIHRDGLGDVTTLYSISTAEEPFAKS